MTGKMSAVKGRIADYYSNPLRQHKLKIFTFIMFLALALEKILSGATAAYVDGDVHLYFSLRVLDLVSVAIYVSTAFLLSARMEYKYLLIPDFVLLVIKIYNVITGCVQLDGVQQIGVLSELSTVESVVEGFLFALFLITLFAGKLSKGKILNNYPVICLRLLIFCFPVTVLFEVAKVVAATELHQYPFIILFNFAKGVLNEAFLDLPYFLLVLTVCFTSNDLTGRLAEKRASYELPVTNNPS